MEFDRIQQVISAIIRMDIIDVPEVKQLPELSGDVESPTEFADMVLTTFLRFDPAFLYAEHSADGSPDTCVSWRIHPQAPGIVSREFEAGISPSLDSFRASLRYIRERYMGEAGSRHGCAERLLRQGDVVRRCLLFLPCSEQAGFWIERMYRAFDFGGKRNAMQRCSDNMTEIRKRNAEGVQGRRCGGNLLSGRLRVKSRCTPGKSVGGGNRSVFGMGPNFHHHRGRHRHRDSVWESGVKGAASGWRTCSCNAKAEAGNDYEGERAWRREVLDRGWLSWCREPE